MVNINNGQLFLDGTLIDLGHSVNQAEIHDGVLIVELSTINMDDEQMRRNVWGLDPLTGKVLWRIQNRPLLPGQDPNEIAPDPFTGFWVGREVRVNTAIGHMYILNAKDGTVKYDSYVG